MKDTNDPFWATPPYILLTDILQLDKVEPWNVDVGKLVRQFLQEMKNLGDVNFRVSGNALYSASVIFMKKTRDLVDLGLIPREEDEEEEDIEIPLIRPPFRLNNRRITLEELVVAMDEVLSKKSRSGSKSKKKKTEPTPEPVSFKVDMTRADIEETIAEVYEDLRRMMETGEVSKFTDILINNTRQEIVRIFFALLHLHGRAYVDIWMDDEDVIWVQLLEPPEKKKGVSESQVQTLLAD
ncbi:MAG: segregation/condensation protein A [Candidatus Thorarchaeota archaeon]